MIGWGYSDVAVDFHNNIFQNYDTALYFTADQQTWNTYPYVAKTISATFLNNKIDGNTHGAGMGTTGAYNLNLSGNWWGSNVPAAVKAAVNAGAGMDYTPWLDSGTDTSGDPGFQGSFATLWVDDDSAQTGSAGRIQEGIDLVSGSTVNVAAGHYAERLTVSKAVTLLGATAGVSKKNYVVPAGYAYDPNVESIIMPSVDAPLAVVDVKKTGGGDIAGPITVKGFVLTDQGAVDNNAQRGLINLDQYTGLPNGVLIENNVIGPHTGPGSERARRAAVASPRLDRATCHVATW